MDTACFPSVALHSISCLSSVFLSKTSQDGMQKFHWNSGRERCLSSQREEKSQPQIEDSVPPTVQRKFMWMCRPYFSCSTGAFHCAAAVFFKSAVAAKSSWHGVKRSHISPVTSVVFAAKRAPQTNSFVICFLWSRGFTTSEKFQMCPRPSSDDFLCCVTKSRHKRKYNWGLVLQGSSKQNKWASLKMMMGFSVQVL